MPRVGWNPSERNDPSKPAEFIEVKPPGKAEDDVRQALEYAFHSGVPFIVLTDGKPSLTVGRRDAAPKAFGDPKGEPSGSERVQTCIFYLPAEQGSYEDRRVYKLDLFERPPTCVISEIW